LREAGGPFPGPVERAGVSNQPATAAARSWAARTARTRRRCPWVGPYRSWSARFAHLASIRHGGAPPPPGVEEARLSS